MRIENQSRDRRAASYLYLVYGVVAVIFLSTPLSMPVQSFKAFMSYIFNPIPFAGAQAEQRLAGVPAGIGRLIMTDIENRRLQDQVKNMALLQAQLDSALRENERLRTEISLKPSGFRTIRWAHVMERDPLNWYRSIMIDAGRDDGIELNSPVLGMSGSTAAVVGEISEAGPHWAKVLLITDEISSVASYIPSKSWEGLVEGQGSPLLKMNYLSMQAQISLGDAIYTSNTSVTYPADILIGSVTKIFSQDPFLTFQAVGVAPAVEASTLKEVMILSPQKMETAKSLAARGGKP